MNNAYYWSGILTLSEINQWYSAVYSNIVAINDIYSLPLVEGGFWPRPYAASRGAKTRKREIRVCYLWCP